MKKCKFLAFALFAVLTCVSFASCSDDDKDAPSSADIVGTWECVSGTEHGGAYEEHDFAKGAIIKFLAGNKAFIEYWGGSAIFGYTEANWDSEEDETWTLKGDNLTIMESDLDRYVGTISVNGNEMTYSYKYEDWNGSKYVEFGPYVSKFVKK